MSGFSRRVIAASLAGASLALAAGAASAQEKLVVWFTKGFYPAEDSALNIMVERFEKKTGVKVELSLYAVQDIIPKTVAALDAKNVPDVAFGLTYDFQTAGKWAAEGKLNDLSDVIGANKDRYLPNTISTANLMGPDGKKRYYAMPVYQQTIHVNYWKDMLAEAGFKDTDIPKGWKEYWSFWCDKVQPAYRQKTGKRIYAIGNPMGVDSTDSFFSFYQFMLAYNVRLVDDSGKLVLDDPKNKAGIVSALKDYTDIMAKGCTPPSSISWKDPDNNVAFHNKTTIMTHNATISIAAKWLDDMNNSALTAEQRAQAKKNYEELIATTGWPNKPDGKPMNYLAAIKLAVAFKGAKNEKRAKEFLAFMSEDTSLLPYTEGALGRWYPVTKGGADRDFWVKDTLHRKVVSNQFRAGTGVFPFVYNYKFTTVNNENVYAKAMSRVVNDKWTPERAVDEMIARIKQLAG
ncbi:MAG: extracellular solute-binding protein [Burkholderiales bacterium]|nr:extracellular solute-binding protein [Burkholderiales bacterium]